jgi:chromosome segregation ATPase
VTDTSSTPDAADLQAEIETTREDLSQTVDLLTAKLDVKTRVRGRANRVRNDVESWLRAVGDRARKEAENADRTQVSVAVGVLAVAVAALTVTLWRRNRPSQRRWRA